MNRQNFLASSGPFKSASSLLGFQSGDRSRSHRKTPSLDDSDYEGGRGAVSDMEGRRSRNARQSSTELTPRSIPLINLSRSPSPYSRNRSTAQSEDEDDLDGPDMASSRPLVARDIGSGGRRSWTIFQRGGLGHAAFNTSIGWQIYIALLVFWVGGCQFGLLLINRFILWTGTYKFPYPLTMTFIQLAITHLLLLAFASLTRGLSGLFQILGFGAIIAPSRAFTRGPRASRYMGGQKQKPVWRNVTDWLTHGSGGIAGGGLFEFQWNTARKVLPLAVVFMAKIVLSNLSYAYAVLPMYMLARIAIVPLSLILTTILLSQDHSVQTQSSTLVATLNLLMATISPGRVTWESIVSGVFSSFFVALYPILQLKCYKALVHDLAPNNDLLASPDEEFRNSSGNKEETCAYWRVLHYTSILSMMLLLPFVILSGELTQIRRNCYFLDVPWFWFLILCSSLGSFTVFSFTLLLIKATSPLSATFVSTPRSVFQLVVLSKFRVGVHGWVGAGLCIASCFWYIVVQRREGRGRTRARLEGRQESAPL